METGVLLHPIRATIRYSDDYMLLVSEKGDKYAWRLMHKDNSVWRMVAKNDESNGVYHAMVGAAAFVAKATTP